jgi:hypothetical protein
MPIAAANDAAREITSATSEELLSPAIKTVSQNWATGVLNPRATPAIIPLPG